MIVKPLGCFFARTQRYSNQSKPQGPHQPLAMPETSLTADILTVVLASEKY